MSTALAPNRQSSDAARRALVPEVLFVADAQLVLALGAGATRRAILRGDLGPYGRLGRRLFVRRDSLLAALAAREVDPSAPLVRLLRPDGDQA